MLASCEQYEWTEYELASTTMFQPEEALPPDFMKTVAGLWGRPTPSGRHAVLFPIRTIEHRHNTMQLLTMWDPDGKDPDAMTNMPPNYLVYGQHPQDFIFVEDDIFNRVMPATSFEAAMDGLARSAAALTSQSLPWTLASASQKENSNTFKFSIYAVIEMQHMVEVLAELEPAEWDAIVAAGIKQIQLGGDSKAPRDWSKPEPLANYRFDDTLHLCEGRCKVQGLREYLATIPPVAKEPPPKSDPPAKPLAPPRESPNTAEMLEDQPSAGCSLGGSENLALPLLLLILLLRRAYNPHVTPAGHISRCPGQHKSAPA